MDWEKASTEDSGTALPRAATQRPFGNDDFCVGAVAQSFIGIINYDPVEAVYLQRERDHSGQLLSGTKTYTLTFPSNGLPDVEAFGSMIMYGADNNLVSNSISRYKVAPIRPDSTGFSGSLTLEALSTFRAQK
jgi:hypothetical protein